MAPAVVRKSPGTLAALLKGMVMTWKAAAVEAAAVVKAAAHQIGTDKSSSRHHFIM